MYPDPKRVRQHRIMLRLDEYEIGLITALANYQGEPVATLARQLIMREAASLLTADDADSVTA